MRNAGGRAQPARRRRHPGRRHLLYPGRWMVARPLPRRAGLSQSVDRRGVPERHHQRSAPQPRHRPVGRRLCRRAFRHGASSVRCATAAAGRSPCARSFCTRNTGCRSGHAATRICPTCACGGYPIRSTFPNRRIRHRPLTTSAIPAALPCPSALIATAGKPEVGNGTEPGRRWRKDWEQNGCRIAVRRRKGTGAAAPALRRALAPAGRDAPRGRGLPEEQGG